jgi:signal transduction histidine kinase
MVNRLNAFNSTRLIASGRLLLAEFLFFCAATDPGNTGFRPEWDDMIALGYLALSLLVMVVVWRSWWADFILFPAVFALDIVIFLMLPWSLHPQWASFSVAAVAIAAFILLCSSVRWNWRTTVVFAVGLNLAGVGLSFARDIGWATGTVGPPSLNVGEDLRRLLLLALVSLFIVWAGLRLTDPRLGKFAPQRSAIGQPFMGEVLHAALDASSALSGAIVWTDRDASGSTVLQLDSQGAMSNTEIDAVPSAESTVESWPLLFDLPRNRAINITEEGEFSAHRSANLDTGLLHRLPFESGISVPLDGVTGHGRLVLSGIPLMSWDHLRLAQALGSEVAHALDRDAFELSAREAALARLRQTVARDLHDSVAQSLAGARFWLRALKARTAKDKELSEEIGQVETAFESENLHIRELIRQLRRAEQVPGQRSLTDDLGALLETLGMHWRIETGLNGLADPLPVPYRLSFEVQQIVREAVANAVRHGQASKVELTLGRNGSGLHLAVADNGSGFPGEEHGTAPVSISERVSGLGGTIEVSSSETGARLDLHFPAGARA